MPGVVVLNPNVPTMQNGSSTHTITEIKDLAKDTVQRVGRGASASSLLATARTQIRQAHKSEADGDLKNAFSGYTKAASLLAMFLETAEFRQEAGKKGALHRDFSDFQQHEGSDLFVKSKNVEAKLAELERAAAAKAEEEPSSPVAKTGGLSLADRMRSLQSAGLSVSTTKRMSREIQSLSPPMSPDNVRPNILALNALTPPSHAPGLFSQSLGSPTSPTPPPQSAHVLVPTSSLGPPSPSSSTSSSPQMSVLSFQDFAHTYPTIDEIDEMDALRLPSAPTGTTPNGSWVDKSPLNGDYPPLIHPKPFPALPMDPGPRPSSTPIPPTFDSFISRPSSPSRPPLSPTVPRKPSGLSLHSPVIAPSTLVVEKSELPFKALFPSTLHEYRSKPNFKILVLDVRTREEFEREHIKVNAIVCIDPTVLLRENVSAQSIQDSLSVAPANESVLFKNREKFDLVAMYDDSSETLGDPRSPLACLMRAIYEHAFTQMLRHMPMVLIGGLQAWKREYGDAELVHGGSPSAASSSLNTLSHLTNGAMSSASSSLTSSPEPKSLGLGHVRAPAESSVVAPTPTVPTHDFASLAIGRSRSGTESTLDGNAHKPWIPPSQFPGGSPRMSMDASVPGPSTGLVRRPAINRPTSNSISHLPHAAPIPENFATQHVSPPLINGTSPIQYPQLSRHISPQLSGSSFAQMPGMNGPLSLPPQASINPSPLSRRRSDYIDQSQEAVNGLAATRTPIDYPELSSHNILRPPPIAASSTLDNRPRLPAPPQLPTIQSEYPVTFWSDTHIGTTGLKNLGNTCYMNSTIQCLSATVPFARFFTDGRWKNAVNMLNPLGTKGNLAQAFANIARDLWQGEGGTLLPVTFRRSLCAHAPQFGGTEQHDSQEFLSFLLDGLHEDLNRILQKQKMTMTPEQEAELERLPTQIASEQQWQIYRMRDDSPVVDFFQGQYRNRLECLTCHATSTSYNSFMYLTLPIPNSRTSKVALQQCIDAFVKEEVMEKSDAWHCPKCNALRKASKRLSLSRLPPILLIHLKRFASKGMFTDKIETFIEFPLKGLDLTNYMPAPLPPGVGGLPPPNPDDPRSQIPPYRYDLYAVTNHFGTLSTGHYTAFIASRGGWLYCDDSKVSHADAKDVVGKPAYILFYKRVKA